jgi:hypothetical protein
MGITASRSASRSCLLCAVTTRPSWRTMGSRASFIVTRMATAASTASCSAWALIRSLRICSYAGTPAAVTLAATAPSVHQARPAVAAPACIPDQVARATPARLMPDVT